MEDMLERVAPPAGVAAAAAPAPLDETGNLPLLAAAVGPPVGVGGGPGVGGPYSDSDAAVRCARPWEGVSAPPPLLLDLGAPLDLQITNTRTI